MVKDLCFEIIDKCLNHCKFCSSNSCLNSTQSVSYEDFKRVIDYFQKNGGIEELSLSGGEPFLHKDLLKMVSYTKSLGIRTVIFTSGVVYHQELSEEEREYWKKEQKKYLEEIDKFEKENTFLKDKIKKYYQNLLNPPKFSKIPKETLLKLKQIGLDKIVFDYQGYESKTDNYLMERPEISRASFLDSLFNAYATGLNIDIHFIPLKPNYQEISDILELLELIKVPNISILNFLPQGRGKQNQRSLQLTKQELQEFFLLLEKGATNYSGKIRIGIPLQGKNTHKCNAGLEKLDIKYDGTVLPCPAFKELTEEECQKYHIKLPNIYTSLDSIKIKGTGTRKEPLCQEIYKYRKKMKKIQ